jgi:hypothetical protein
MAVLPVGIGPVTGYNIERSLRFNSADSAYLSRTQSAGTSTRIITWSGWVKRSKLNIGAYSALFSAGTSTTDTLTFNNSGDTLRLFLNGASGADLITTQQFRDVSAWYHIVLAIDTTQATASNRVKIYVNGSQITAFSTATYPSQNYDFTDLNINSLTANIGSIGTTQTFDGYMAEVYFIDGQALTPSSFGETDAQTGVWKPKAYTGTYGTNGFFLKFADNSNTTAATLGKDYSGNGNNWTPNLFSVTAGAGNDSLVDTPTPYGSDTGVGGEVRGNYATINAVDYNSTYLTLSNGNLQQTYAGVAAAAASRATISIPSTGKWYWEVYLTTIGTNNTTIRAGICSPTIAISGSSIDNASTAYLQITNGQKRNNASDSTYGAGFSATQILQVLYDATAGSLYFGQNNSFANGTGSFNQTFSNAVAAFTGLSGEFMPCFITYGGSDIAINFGQRPFAYTAPSGFKALCTANLPTPTIGATSTTQAGDYFNVVTYTGNATSRSITGVGFQPDFVWIKNRTTAFGHLLYDAIRGTGVYLASNSTDGDTSFTNGLTSFNSDGFGLGTANAVNENSSGLVAWNWNAGGSNATNTSGTITSTVRANTTAGFSIVTYTGNNTANQSVGHGLGVAPSMIIVKNRTTAATSWAVYHTSVGLGKYLELNKTDATSTNAAFFDQVTTTVFGFDAGGSFINANGDNYVAYCFAAVAGYSAFGSYTGNGSTDGPFVYTGFRPRFIMVKKTATGTGNTGWYIFDSARDSYNLTGQKLYANTAESENGASGETTTTNSIDILSNGFKLRTTNGATNDSQVFIYDAFAEFPTKFALAR